MIIYETFHVTFRGSTMEALVKILEQAELESGPELAELTDFENELRARLQHLAEGSIQSTQSTPDRTYHPPASDSKAERRRARRMARKLRRAGMQP